MFQFNLGWKLSLVYKGYTSAALLDSYQEERLPVIAEMLGKTTELFNRTTENRGDININLLGRNSDMTQLGINYRGSSIIGEDDIRDTTLKVSGYNKDSETAACPGDRAPEVPSLIDATGTEHKHETLFNIFSPSHHSVIVFTKKYEEYSALALSSVIKRLPENTVRSVLILPSESNVNELGVVYDKVFIDSGGHGHSYYGLPSDQSYFVVVRPDGVVGARVHEVAGVERYFQKIFS